MYYKDGKRVDNCEESTQNEPKTNAVQLDYILTLIKNIHKEVVLIPFYQNWRSQIVTSNFQILYHLIET